MVSTLSITIFSLTLLYCYSTLRSLRRNVNKAKESGLPYVISPVYFQSIWWVILQEPLLPLLRALPTTWTQSWLSISLFGRIWHVGHQPFNKLESDTFIVVSPSGNVLWTCDSEAILQFTKRHHDFVKPVKMMGMLNMYGPTITATEGEESRLYRRITAPSFNEGTHGLAWSESLRQAAAMLTSWVREQGPAAQVKEDTARLTLHVISYVCFDRNLEWKDDAGHKAELNKGHTLSYREAISSMLDNTGVLFVTPGPVLNSSPLQIHKNAKQSFVEWRMYMEEMRDETQAKLSNTTSKQDPSLLGSLVQASIPESLSTAPLLSPQAVLGNIFIFIIAGHETSANTLTYAITLLACRPQIQKALQADLDEILDARSQSSWSFESDFPNLLDGYCGAVMNEVLRLYTVLPFLPKMTESAPRPLRLGDRSYIVPADTLIMIDTSATHRNPKYWPRATAASDDGAPFPVSSFDPARWLQHDNGSSRSMFTPEPGSFVPFAEGPRACIGKRFAQAQFCAVLATIFKDYSVELVVDEQEKGKLGGKEHWDAARIRAERQLSTGVEFMTSLKMKESVPLKLVRRGEERWL